VSDIVFVDELPPAWKANPRPRRAPKRPARALWRVALEARPGQWARIKGPYKTSKFPKGWSSAYVPLGFQFAQRRQADGFYLYARYVGPANT